jgi:hypothetical protein
MEADIGWSINPVSHKQGKIKLTPIFGETVVSVPELDQKTFLHPSSQVVLVETGLPGINLIGGEANRIKQLSSEFLKIHVISDIPQI